MPPDAHRPPLAVAGAVAPGRGLPPGPAAEAVAFGDDVAVALTVGRGVDADVVADRPGHALPYAADGKSPGDWAASMDERTVPAGPSVRAGWAGVNCQASTATAAIPPLRMKNRRRQ
jgi:hypothetical protein